MAILVSGRVTEIHTHMIQVVRKKIARILSKVSVNEDSLPVFECGCCGLVLWVEFQNNSWWNLHMELLTHQDSSHHPTTPWNIWNFMNHQIEPTKT